MRKVLVVLVAMLMMTGLGAVAYAHMGGGNAGPQGNGPGYGWNCPMATGGMSHMGMGPHMGQGTNVDGRAYANCCGYRSGNYNSPSPDPAHTQHGPAPEGQLKENK